MKRLFTLAIFFSATLLFMVQPLVGKMLLPVLGGSPAVWSTCMVFFQAVLLLGYVYAHVLTTRVPQGWQRTVHAGVLIVASVTLLWPAQIGAPGNADPLLWLLWALARSVGLPFFALSATAPLLQQWFSRTEDPDARDPYFLYASSNAGSLLGLLGYLLIEPLAARSSQVLGWSVGFFAVAALIAACASRAGRVGNVGRVGKRTRTQNPATRTQNPAPSTQNRFLWVVLAAVPSALVLGVTQHLATDVVSAPFVWVVPLAIYLATFIAAFTTPGQTQGRARWWGAVAPSVALLILLISLAVARYPIFPIAVAHLFAFTVLAMMCHTRLAETRPDPARLTEYFVCVSLGGVLGSATVALVAPLVFSWIVEYPLAIAAAILLRPQTAEADRMANSLAGRWAWRAGAALLFVAGYSSVSVFNQSADAAITQRFLRMSFAIPAILLLFTPRTALLFAGTTAGLLVGAGLVRTGGEVLHRERTFFGVHEVTSLQQGAWHVLTHGTTTHGLQAFRGKVQALPTAYYHPTGPIGDVVFTLSPEGRFRDVAVIGLGAGALAAYAGSGVHMDFFEVDEAVIRIAEDPRYFKYLSDARARPGTTVRIQAVDGRLGLRAMPEASYDLIVVDAFSSDAIPTHLLTREAVAMFASRLKPRGVMAFHVSNRFFNLAPVLARIAEDQGLVCYTRSDKDVPPERAAEAMRPSVWVVLARNEVDLGQLARSAPRWVRASGKGMSVWTDDYTNVLSAIED